MSVQEPSLIDLEAEMPTGAKRSYEPHAERLNERASCGQDDAIVRTYGNCSEFKVCSKCGESKELTCFQARKGRYRKPGDLFAECKACTAARRRLRYATDAAFAERHSNNVKNSYSRTRSEAITRYGSRCACCGEDNELFLTFDHIENDGAEHRRAIGDGGKYLLCWIKKNHYPDCIQLLCYNCNCAKGFYGVCPHKSNRKRLAEMLSRAEE